MNKNQNESKMRRGATDKDAERRHYIAVLIQANRYRRDGNVPSIYKMPSPTELGKAIDYAVRELKRGMNATKRESNK